jgi:hypothetical protein
MCNAQNSLLLNRHNGDDAPQDYKNGIMLTDFLKIPKIIFHENRSSGSRADGRT